jgi:serine/threonine protein kinase/outer membrane biosynthesis protein TonB
VIGRTISHYRIVSQLAAGGMGVVYRAEDVRLGREVAVKCVLDDFANDEQAVGRLRAEARAASALNHGNICTIYDIGEVDGHPFIVMELLKGESLREKLVNGALKVHKVVEYGIEIADALSAAHTHGIIHRDIKPGNIFITERGHVKVLDFGLAKLAARREEDRSTDETYQMTEIGVTLGTIAYMSPEQATGEDLDQRTDLFSLGVVLYECATGQHPFPGSTSAVTLSGILTKAPVAPVTLNREIPLRLQEVINNCLEKDRDLRYQSAADLGADLKRVRRDMDSGRSTVMHLTAVQRAVASESGPAAAPGSGPAAVPSSAPASGASTSAPRSSSWPGIAAGAVAATLLVGGGVWYALSGPADQPEPQTDAAQEPASAAPDPLPPAQGTSVSEVVQSRAQLAAASLKGGSYRAALSAATEVLALDPGHSEAQRIRDEARAMLERFDRALAEARERINARDINGASRALDTARSIDPAAPGVTAVGAMLSAAANRANASPPAARTSAPAQPAAEKPAPPPPVQPTPPPAPPPSVPVTGPPATTGAPASTALPTAPVQEPAPPPAPVKKAPEGPTPEQDEQAIRQAVATYGRAIESKDLSLYRSIWPTLSAEQARLVQEGFRAVTSQRVELTITSLTRQGNEATVTVRRRDTIQAGGQQSTRDSQQTMTMSRQGARWVIVNIR